MKGLDLPGPMRLAPQVKEVVWGGRWLADSLGRHGEPGGRLGESWEAFSGSRIGCGQFAGRTLADLFSQFGESMFGTASARYPRFPLLVKFIEARQNLSIQVHPDDQLALELERYPYGKTEFWYVLEAAPGAEIVYGLTSGRLTRDSIRAALEEGDSTVWRRVPVRAGDVVFIPAGTVHALTEGIVVYELQQDCDITYRLFDWGRSGREIHIEKGLRCIDPSASLQVSRPRMETADGYSLGVLASCAFFRADLYEVSTRLTLESRSDSFALLTCIEGRCAIGSQDEDLQVNRGDTLFLPAGVTATVTAASDKPSKLIAAALR